MAITIQVRKPVTYKADIIFGDGSRVGATFRLPRPIDIYQGVDGNTNENNIRTFCNCFVSFDKKVEITLEDGSIIEAASLAQLIELGVDMDLGNVLLKWYEAHQKSIKDKEELVKKFKSAGNSTSKGTTEEKE